ncbi:MAG: hypothetical protein ACR2QM_01220, partial [Longimicrobiales bacterium]
MNLVDAVSQAKESRLGRWLVAYGGGAIIVAGLLESVAEPWGLSALFLQRAHVALLAGLPTAGILAWHHGKRGRQKATLIELCSIGVIWLITGAALTQMDGSIRERRVGDRTGKGVAVMVLEHRAPDRDRAYVTEGIHETITNALAEVSDLVVSSRASILSLESDLSLSAVAGQLGADYVIGGSVQWGANELLVTLELTDVDSGRSLWSGG